MLSEFEQRLVNVLGTRLPAPFGGRVEVAPGSSPGGQPLIVVGVGRIEPVELGMGSRRPQIVPGSDEFRRVLRLNCVVEVTILPANNAGRSQQLAGLDALLYALDEADLRDGSGLVEAGDQGFLIESMQLDAARGLPDLSLSNGPEVNLLLRAAGWFWPVGEAGQAGVQIGEIRVRGVNLPLQIIPAWPQLTAGGPPVELALRLGAGPLMRLSDQAEPLPALPFGSLAVALVGPGGGAGSGALSGGTAGVDGVRLVDLVDGEAAITYTPPAETATDDLVVGLDDGEDGMGIELGRFTLPVRGA